MVSQTYLRLYSVTAILLKDLPYQDKSHRMLPLMVLDFFEKNPCREHYTIHVMNNAFHKGIIALGQDLEGLAFDLQAWFNRSSCKEYMILENFQTKPFYKMSLLFCDISTKDGWHYTWYWGEEWKDGMLRNIFWINCQRRKNAKTHCQKTAITSPLLRH